MPVDQTPNVQRMKRIFHSFRSSSRQLGPLEQRVLDALWARGSATVRELLENSLPGPGLHHGDDHAGPAVQERSSDAVGGRQGVSLRCRDSAVRSCIGRQRVYAFRQLLDASPASSLPLSFLVEILGERDAQLLDDLRKLVESKRRELGQRELANATGPKERE